MFNINSPLLGEEESFEVNRILLSGNLSQGIEVDRFEKEFSSYVSGKKCIATNSGTSSLHLALLASGIGPGDEVIIPSFSFIATANAVALTGATPIFADIDLNNYCLDPSSVEECISSKTVAILVVHLFGNLANMDAFQELAKKYKIKIFEDACQAHGAIWDDKPVGTMSSWAAFSFYPTKNMTSGEGGMVVTNDINIERKVRLLRNQGLSEKSSSVIGFNNRMTDIHAAIGRVQLRKLNHFVLERRKNANYYNNFLNVDNKPKVNDRVFHSYNQYVIRVTDREKLIKEIGAKVPLRIYYSAPIHSSYQFSQSEARTDLSNTNKVCQQVISLPIGPRLIHKDREKIVSLFNKMDREKGK
jgi:perosamine synthetase